MRKKITLALLSLLLVPLAMMAQDVTVHPGNGSMMPALKSGKTDTFYEWKGFATWKHEQLSLTMTTGDSDNNLTGAADEALTASGQLAKPANDIFATAADANGKKYLQIGKGRQYTGLQSPMETFITLALPKGYRFTGYTIKFHRISHPTPDGVTVRYSSRYEDYYMNSLTSNNLVDETSGDLTFGETDNSLSFTNADGTYKDNIGQDYTTQHTITRTSQTMGNVLYFKLISSVGSGRAFIQLDHVELQFTAEHNTPTLIPATAATNVSAVDIPFTTSKIDYGQLIMRDINGHAQGQSGYDASTARMSYDGTIRDMNANMTLYEEGSVTENDVDNEYDGTKGKMLQYHSGSISSAGNYFKLESSRHPLLTDDGEAIYYIESPIWAINSAAANPHKNPIGYRIVSAKFNYAAGTGDTYLPATFKIQYESVGHGPDQDGTYGLNTFSTTYNWNPSYHTVWRIDQDGYIYGYVTSDGSIRYLYVDGTAIKMTSTKPNATVGTFEVVVNDGVSQICRKNITPEQYIGWQEVEGETYIDDNGEENVRVTRSPVIAADAAHRSTYNEVTPASTAAHGAYTFKIYGPDGTTAVRTINVGETGGSETVYGYNNDAIKIGIKGTGLINAEITMQALDPYIDRLDIVCQENGGTGGKLTQQFSATDFAVKGGKFTFYVPEGFPAPAKFTFENLYSPYGDDSYYGNTSSTNHARYFFVKSQYEQTADNVYERNNEDSYTTKILTEKTGNKKFTFNNASTVGSAGGYFEEYAFTPSIYTKSTAQGGAGGTFADFTFSQTEMTSSTTKTAYLFTCDEPRYNIAPTTATQHVYYAFYEMKIDMQTKTYQPTLTWEKLYDNTFYSANNSDIKRDSKWGLKLTTTETVDDHGSHSGYLTVTQILDKIDKRTGDNTVAGGPKNTDQIMFIDGSKLMSIVENQTANTSGGYASHPKSELMDVLDQNALIYLPYGSKSDDDNFAFNTIEEYNKTPIFRAANDIVITDRYPFYAPYDIQVDAAKIAKYERSVTNQDLYGDDDQHLTIVLPFEIDVDDNGLHTNSDGQGSSFTLATMNESNALSKKTGSMINFYKDGADGYFTPISEKSEANKPYVVTMQGTAGESSFKVHVNGSLVKATPNKTGIFEGETASGTYKYKENDVEKTVNYSFTHKGTYTGIEIGGGKDGAAASDTTVFYFANNMFLDSKTLVNKKSLKMLPYRSYYDYTGSGAGAKMARFRIVFGENDEDDTTGITAVQKNSNLAIIPGDGYITIMAKADSNVAIHTVNGMAVEKCNLRAGETRTVAMPSGIYVINGVKMVVK